MKWAGPWGLLGLFTLARVALWRYGLRSMPAPPGLAASEPLLAGLLPEVASRARQLLTDAWGEGIPLVVTSGYRSLAEQGRLYEQGRTTPGTVVTDARPGSSWHNYRRAFDVAVRDANGRATWPQDSALWAAVGRLGRSLGLEWGRDFGDDDHFDYHPGLTLEQAMAGVAA